MNDRISPLIANAQPTNVAIEPTTLFTGKSIKYPNTVKITPKIPIMVDFFIFVSYNKDRGKALGNALGLLVESSYFLMCLGS